MKTVFARFCLVALSLTLTSCAVDMDRRAIWAGLADSEVDLGASGRATLTGPIRLGVAPPLRASAMSWRAGEARFDMWSEAEREVMRRWGEEFKQKGVLEDMVFLPQLLLGRDAVKKPIPALRAAAEAAGVDAILVTNSRSQTGRQINALALLDITIVGAFLVPGHHGKAITAAEGVVVDVRTNRVYAFGEGEGEATTMTAFAYLDDVELVHESRVASIDALGRQLFGDVESQIWAGARGGQ